MSHPAAPAFQSDALPAIPSIAGPEPSAASDSRIFWRSPRGTLPTPAELHAENVARAVDGDPAAIMERLQRGTAEMVRGARLELAMVAR